MIGKGAPTKAGSADTHGAALGEKEVAATRVALSWPHPPFVIPAVDLQKPGMRATAARNRKRRGRRALPPTARRIRRKQRSSAAGSAGELPDSWPETAAALVAAQAAKAASVATRKASQQALDTLGPALPELLGGAADLTGSVFTNWAGSVPVTKTTAGNYVHFGVREFGMSAIANGLALHGGFIPYVGTFLTFSDYARNALRMAALMKLRSIFVFTHDSIGLGEDGPTHQAVEHTASLRLIPHLDVWRPCDTVETAAAWVAAIARADGPTALILTRQNVPFQPRDAAQCQDIAKGGYVLADFAPNLPRRVVLLATGSEVALAMGARTTLQKDGLAARVVSLPCTSVFERQDPAWRASVLPPSIPRLAIEAGATAGWRAYVGALDDPHAAVLGLDTFGESAPASALFPHFGFTIDAVVAAARKLV